MRLWGLDLGNDYMPSGNKQSPKLILTMVWYVMWCDKVCDNFHHHCYMGDLIGTGPLINHYQIYLQTNCQSNIDHIAMLTNVEKISSPGPRFNIKMLSYQYRKSHCGDKTVVRSSYLHNGISYTGRMSSLYWIRAQMCSFFYSWPGMIFANSSQVKKPNPLTHCGLMMPYGNIGLAQHWLRKWPLAWQHQAITWTSVDLSSEVSSPIHIRSISQEVLMKLIHNMCFEITLLKPQPNPPGDNELNVPLPEQVITPFHFKMCKIQAWLDHHCQKKKQDHHCQSYSKFQFHPFCIPSTSTSVSWGPSQYKDVVLPV